MNVRAAQKRSFKEKGGRAKLRAHQVYYIVQLFFKSCSLQLVKARARKAAKSERKGVVQGRS